MRGRRDVDFWPPRFDEVVGRKATTRIVPRREVSPMARKINVNTAGAAALAELPAIGPGLADRIVDYRSRVGHFRTVEELAAVPGLSDRTIARFRARIGTDEDATEAPMPDLPPLEVRVRLSNTAGLLYTG